MKKTLLSLIVLASGFASINAMAADTPTAAGGTVHFNGKVVEEPCVITQDTTDQTVNLGEVATAGIATKGTMSPKVPFTIKLDDCDTTTISTATFSFTGTPDAADATAIANTASGTPATNVGVQMLDSAGAVVPLDASPVGAVTTLVDGLNTVDFSAYMIATGDGATAGDVLADATFTVAYE